MTSVVVADPSGSTESAARKIFGKKLTDFGNDFQQTLSKHKPTMAIITLEAVQSPPVIRLALEANCHVVAEKPSCIKLEDFEPLARLAEMKHRFLMLALANRLRGTIQTARRMIRAGKLGQIYGCELHTIADQTRLKNPAYHKSWFADKNRAAGGHLMWLGIHWIDLIMYLTDSKIVETAGFTGIVGGQPVKAEDASAMAFRFDNGSFGTINSGYYLDRDKQLSIRIWGSKGWLELDYDGGDPLKWYFNDEPSPQIHKYDGPPDDGSYSPMVEECVKASLSPNGTPFISPDECVRVLKTVFACYRAAESGQTQRV